MAFVKMTEEVEISTLPNPIDTAATLDCLTNVQKFTFREKKLITKVKENKSTIEKMIEIEDDLGEIFQVKEESKANWLSRLRYGSLRKFEMRIENAAGDEIIRLSRRVACPTFLAVYASNGVLIGTIEQVASLFPTFKIKNHLDEKVFTVEGPMIMLSRAIQFKVKSETTETVQLTKVCDGCIYKCYDMANIFSNKFEVQFPSASIDNRMKAMFIGMVVLFNFMFF